MSDSKGAGKESVVPLELLQSFLNHAIEALEQKTNHHNHDDAPTNLATLRTAVLGIQLSCLETALVEYNQTAGSEPVAMESVQRVLREVGGGTLDGVSFPTEEAKSHLTAGIASMNDAARCALARLVLRQEFGKGVATSLSSLSTENRSTPPSSPPRIPQSDMMEFCGLCRATWKLEEVQTYLRDGTAPYADLAEKASGHRSLTVQDRMDHVQTAILRALGYDWKLAVREMRRILTPKQLQEGGGGGAEEKNQKGEEEEEEEEEELREAVRRFVAESTLALTEATLGYRTDDRTGMPSDQNDGGVTRVVSVQYSEKFVNADDPNGGATTTVSTGAPLEEQMDARHRQQEEEQRDWEMARQAASLQQSILAQLLQMEPDERDAELANAKQVHNDFLKEALARPAGPERVAFMQGVDGATQRLLIMHKLWEGMLAQHGGQPPVMRRPPR